MSLRWVDSVSPPLVLNHRYNTPFVSVKYRSFPKILGGSVIPKPFCLSNSNSATRTIAFLYWCNATWSMFPKRGTSKRIPCKKTIFVNHATSSTTFAVGSALIFFASRAHCRIFNLHRSRGTPPSGLSSSTVRSTPLRALQLCQRQTAFRPFAPFRPLPSFLPYASIPVQCVSLSN